MNPKTAIATLWALGLACAPAIAQDGPPPGKMWLGEFTVAGKSTGIIVHDRSEHKDAPSVVDVPSMNARNIPMSNFSMTPAAGKFELQGGPELLKFEGVRRDGKLTGKVMQGQTPGEFTLVQAAPNNVADNFKAAGSYQVAPGHVIDLGPMDEMGGMLIFIDQKTLREGPLYPLSSTRYVSGPSIGVPYPFAIGAEFIKDAKGAITGMRWRDGDKQMTAKKIAPHRVEEVTVVNGEVTLKGVLTLPLGKGPHPAVVFAHGSGPVTRNLGIWTSFFVRQGFAVLSLDKRGAGASTGDWMKSGMDDIAGDWLAGVAMLKGRADIDARRIGVHGSSQGGWTAPLMASRSDDVSFVIVRAGSAVRVAETMAHEIAWTVREGGLSEGDANEAYAASMQLFELAPASWDKFSAAVAVHKVKPWAKFVWPLGQSEKGWGRAWTAMNAPYDPAATLAKVKVPVLWFLGEFDHNVPSADSVKRLDEARTASGNKNFTVVNLKETGHSFVQSKTGNADDFVLATKMVPGYFSRMESWLRTNVINKK
ncbi:MAG: prolyl oligopeptidase family serine peptidase [Pseudomonadota bacterium]